jgi:hypothetical protein
MEKDYHNNDLSEVTKCFRKNLKPSLEVWQALYEIEESYPKEKFRRYMIWFATLFFSLLSPSFVLGFDVGSDYYLLEDYHPDSDSLSSSLFACSRNRTNDKCDRNKPSLDYGDLCMVPQELSRSARYYYLLAFILMPHFLYALEFIQAVDIKRKLIEITKSSMIETKRSYKEGMKTVFAILLYILSMLLKFIFWPFYMIWRSFLSEGKAATSSGEDYFRLTREKDETLILEARSRIIEACTEASFQPLLVLYMALPDIIQIFAHAEEDTDCDAPVLQGIRKYQNIAYQLVINPQIISIFGSIVSLVLSFDMYYETQKRGALGLAGNFYGRLIRLASTLLLVVSRLLALVLCAYCFGEGMFHPMLMLVVCHILLMSLIHYATSYEWEIDQTIRQNQTIRHQTKGDTEEVDDLIPTSLEKIKANVSILYQCLINGIANLYIHNWIVKHTSRQFLAERKTTFLRQVIIDFIFAIENIFVVVMVLNSNLPYLKNLPRSILVIILLFHLLGIILKVIYYHAWHMWAYAFNVVSIDYSHRIPRVSIAIPYYCFGNWGICRFGAKSKLKTQSSNYINRPTVDVIFNRQSIRTPKPQENTTSDYIHVNSLRTSSEKRLVAAIVNASTESKEIASENLDRTSLSQSDFTDLRTLFNEFINDLERKQRNSQEDTVFTFPNHTPSHLV